MTAEQLHDALGLLPSDLIAEADAWRSRPRKVTIQWRRWAAVAACAALILGCGFAVMRSGLPASGGTTEKLSIRQDMAAAEAAPEAPAAAEPTDAAGNNCDCAASQITTDAEEAPNATCGTPPVNTAGAEYRFAELSVTDQVHLIKNPAALEDLGLEADIYDEDWFADFDLLLIALPGITSPEGLDVSVGQGMDPAHWEIRIQNLPEVRVDTGDSLLICIPVQKGHIPKDAAFELIPE